MRLDPDFTLGLSAMDLLEQHRPQYRSCDANTQAYFFCVSACLSREECDEAYEWMALTQRRILMNYLAKEYIGLLHDPRSIRSAVGWRSADKRPEDAIEPVAFKITRAEQLGTTLSDAYVTLKHILANGAVGPLVYFVRRALAQGTIIRRYPVPRPPISPPDLRRIPFSSFMRLPLPYSVSATADFATCHLAAMATPEFLQDGEWVGYYSYSGPAAVPSVTFDDPCREIRFKVTPAGGVLHLQVERALDAIGRFSLTGQLTVRTGEFTLAKDYGVGHAWTLLGVLTPFGLVGTWGTPGWGGWFWFWKAEWSGKV